MRAQRWTIAPFLFALGAVATAGGWLAAEDERAARVTAPAGLPAEAARMYVAVMTPRPGELKWQTIPWLTDLAEGMRLAREEDRPLLLWVTGDEPLEKC